MLDLLEPISRLPLREQAYDRLLAAIVAGRLQPGQRVLDRDLATELGVSRTPVREALQRLEDEGLIETAPGALTRVAPLGASTARETFPVVATLHALAARLGVVRLGPDALEAMTEANSRLAVALARQDPAAAIEADDAFHGVLVGASENAVLALTLKRLTPMIRRLEALRFASLAGRASIRQHQEIVAACRQGRIDQAAQLVEDNWLSLGALIEASFVEPR